MSNTIGILGRLTKDAEQRSIPSGTVITNFSVASDTGFGERKVTTFYNCSYFRKADGLMTYLKKGAQVFITGEHSLRKYPKSDGTEGASSEVNVNNINLVGGAGGNQPSQQQQSSQQQPASQSAGPDYGAPQGGADYLDDDIPF